MNYYLKNIYSIFNDKVFFGWGRKRTGKFASLCHKYFKGEVILLEDGFIRSIGLGIENAPSFSIVEDNEGIYYDAMNPSRLENILNKYDFLSDERLMCEAKKAIKLINKQHISKYNCAFDVAKNYFTKDEKRVLVIAQTQSDSSLEYGLAGQFSTEQMLQSAFQENPNSKVYLKIHPDVLCGKKESDIDIINLDKRINIISENVNSIFLLKHFHTVYTKTSQMGFEALLVGCKCVCFGMPFYAGWGITDDRVKSQRRKRKLSVEEVFAASYILYSKYFNPYTQKKSNIIETIQTILRFKDIECKREKKVFLFGFSFWKHRFIKSFLKEYRLNNIVFINPIFGKHYKKAIKKGLNENCEIMIWGKKNFLEIEQFVEEKNLKITRVEDGFIRSVGLGSDLTRPYSLVFDDEGIYFDSTRKSRLENILNTHNFAESGLLMEEARRIRSKILKLKISKYNSDSEKEINFPKDKKVILVPGQVEDDASIKFGSNGMSNLELLEKVREENLDAYIVYKPHPDVLSGNRIGNVHNNTALSYCDEIIVDVAVSSFLEKVHEVHTITSLVGFEALLYSKKVVTYGMPFYAGWGLTSDKRQCDRRKRKLSLDELCTAVWVLYPRYLNPKTLQFCTAEVLIDELQKEKEKLSKSSFYRFKKKIYYFIVRKLHKLLFLIKN